MYRYGYGLFAMSFIQTAINVVRNHPYRNCIQQRFYRPVVISLIILHSFIHPRTVGVLVLLGSLATSYILATAVNSPEQLWGQTGAVLTVLAWILSGALFSYVKVMNEDTGLCRTKIYNWQFLERNFFLPIFCLL